MTMRFSDRKAAGRALARALQGRQIGSCVVYALPRGGVVLGAEVARALGAPLDLIITRKIGHPLDPEYAVCAVAENGELLCDEAERTTLDPAWLAKETQRESKEAKRRRQVYLAGRLPVGCENKVAILVDDGIATGLTMRAAIASARKMRPKSITVAAPVCPPDTKALLEQEADDVIILDDDPHFLGSVGMYYDSFPQVTDMEVISLLRRFPPAASHKDSQ